VVQMVLDKGATIISKLVIRSAIEDDKKSTIRYFLGDFDLEAVGPSSLTLLMIAAQDGHHAIVEALLLKGARVDTPPALWHSSQTALSHAAVAGHVDIVRLLLVAGAQIDAKCYCRNICQRMC
jgi:ankyrin repeat protein